MAAPKAVLDTDVLLGKYRELLIQLASQGAFTLYLSRFAAWELGRVAQRMGFGEEKHKLYFRRLDAIAELVDHRAYKGEYPDWLSDPEDRHLIAAAVAAHVEYLVTANTSDFPPGETFAGVTVITPEDFIRLLATSSEELEEPK